LFRKVRANSKLIVVLEPRIAASAAASPY